MIDFILKAFELKDEERAGWQLRGVRRPESVGDHSWGTAVLCWLYAPVATSEARAEEEAVDRARALAMAVFHDIAEAQMGDVATRVHESERAIPQEEKQRREREAFATMRSLLHGAGVSGGGGAAYDSADSVSGAAGNAGTGAAASRSETAAELTDLWQEYEDGSSATARFVRDMNLCDMCAQALFYERHRRYDAAADSPAFRNFGALDEFFETSRRRISTEVGGRLFEELERRYRRERESQPGA
ncbi:MAG: HD domain-containing protein [Spirochaetota bacterium]